MDQINLLKEENIGLHEEMQGLNSEIQKLMEQRRQTSDMHERQAQEIRSLTQAMHEYKSIVDPVTPRILDESDEMEDLKSDVSLEIIEQR